MRKFFKPEDFDIPSIRSQMFKEELAEIANAKLEREGKVVFQRGVKGEIWESVYPNKEYQGYKALLVNIETIEKFVAPYRSKKDESCTHLAEKVKPTSFKEEK